MYRDAGRGKVLQQVLTAVEQVVDVKLHGKIVADVVGCACHKASVQGCLITA